MEELREYLGLPEFDWTTTLGTVVNVRGEQRGIYSVVNASMYAGTRDIGDDYPPDVKLKMIEFFHPHNLRLAKLLGRKIDLWATPTSFKKQMEQRK
eukprot:12279_1